MKRTSWPVLERRYTINRLSLFLVLFFLAPFANAGDSHHMVISAGDSIRVGKNQITIRIQTKEGQINSSDNRSIKLDIYSDGIESRTVQIINGEATVELDLKKGPSLLVASDPANPLFVAYKDLMAEEPVASK